MRLTDRKVLGSLLLLAVALLAVGCQGTPGLVSRIEPPQLMSPPDGAVLQCPPGGQDGPSFVFAWTQVRGAAFYVLEVYRATDRFLVASKKVDPGGEGTVSLFCGLEYLWRVGAVADYPADPAWSQIWRFSITGASPGAAGVLRLPAAPR